MTRREGAIAFEVFCVRTDDSSDSRVPLPRELGSDLGSDRAGRVEDCYGV